MKQESIERCIDAVAALDPELPGIRLLVVGGGSAEEDIGRRADKTNADLGRRAVVRTGPLDDPRAAYACADVVCGMGSSVLRGMALGAAAVVVGERGFTEPVRPDTIPVFDRLGFYGVGEGVDPAADPLPAMLLDLFQDADRRSELASWSAELVRGRMSLKRQTDRLLKCYEAAIADRRPFAERGREQRQRARTSGRLQRQRTPPRPTPRSRAGPHPGGGGGRTWVTDSSSCTPAPSPARPRACSPRCATWPRSPRSTSCRSPANPASPEPGSGPLPKPAGPVPGVPWSKTAAWPSGVQRYVARRARC
ncbi:hypothetical protein ACU686_04085 [Yinghuangia aomiensis]